jgi:hypothetical protein
MNRRFVLTAVACLFTALTPVQALSQAKPAWVPPLKGIATVEFTQEKPARVKVKGASEIHTKIKLRNTSKGSIALLSVEEIWYNTKREIATNGTYRYRALLNPGEIIEFTIASPEKPDLYQNVLMFKHANGTVEAKRVPKLQ